MTVLTLFPRCTLSFTLLAISKGLIFVSWIRNIMLLVFIVSSAQFGSDLIFMNLNPALVLIISVTIYLRVWLDHDLCYPYSSVVLVRARSCGFFSLRACLRPFIILLPFLCTVRFRTISLLVTIVHRQESGIKFFLE